MTLDWSREVFLRGLRAPSETNDNRWSRGGLRSGPSAPPSGHRADEKFSGPGKSARLRRASWTPRPPPQYDSHALAGLPLLLPSRCELPGSDVLRWAPISAGNGCGRAPSCGPPTGGIFVKARFRPILVAPRCTLVVFPRLNLDRSKGKSSTGSRAGTRILLVNLPGESLPFSPFSGGLKRAGVVAPGLLIPALLLTRELGVVFRG